MKYLSCLAESFLLRSFVSTCLLVSCLLLSGVQAQGVKKVAIVRDGPSPFFDAIVEGFEKELSDLAEGSYTFELVDSYNAAGNVEDVEKVLMKAMNDPQIDVVYTAGIIASYRAEKLTAELRSKPVVAGAIEFSNFRNEGVSERGTSDRPNFTFILESQRIPADLKQLSRLSGEKTIHSFIDKTVRVSLTKELAPRVAVLEKSLGLDIVVISGGSTAESFLSALPKEAKAVYLPILPSLAKGERVTLLEGLTKRGVLSLSMVGLYDVKRGALAGLSLDNSKALFRRTALNIHQIFSGISTSLLPVVLVGNDRLHINMETANRLKWSPDYETLLAATFLNDEVASDAGSLVLEKSMELAAQANASTKAAKARWQASFWETQSLRTSRRPQVSVSGSYGHNGIANRINPVSQANTDSLALGAEISQLLYSDRVTSQIRAQMEVESATKLDLESIRLDGMETAGLSYIDAILAEALYLIEKENLALAGQNLNLAETRGDIGAAEPSEVFRWQASLSQSKAQLIQRDADRKNARVQLNVVMGERRGKQWKLKDISLQDDDYYFMNETLFPLLKNLNDFESYIGFVQTMAKWRAPELKAFEKNLKAQGILLVERGRRHRMPEINLTAGARQAVTEASQNYDDQSEWSVGIGFTIPLYEGGLKKTETNRIKAVIRQLSAQRDQALYLVEQRALSAIYNASASHPGLILSRQALDAAQKNYDSVQGKYSQGSATIIDLLDAQSQLISQKQSVAVSQYQYLKDIVAVQRSMAWFEFTKTPEQKAEWAKQLRNYLQSGSIHITHGKSE